MAYTDVSDRAVAPRSGKWGTKAEEPRKERRRGSVTRLKQAPRAGGPQTPTPGDPHREAGVSGSQPGQGKLAHQMGGPKRREGSGTGGRKGGRQRERRRETGRRHGKRRGGREAERPEDCGGEAPPVRAEPRPCRRVQGTEKPALGSLMSHVLKGTLRWARLLASRGHSCSITLKGDRTSAPRNGTGSR